MKSDKEICRRCAACGVSHPREKLLRLTVDWQTNEVFLNVQGANKVRNCGRSAYLCRNIKCVDQVLKGHRLHGALQGGRGRKAKPRRRITWPLESQLIHTLRTTCTESQESCHNTEEGGGIR